MFRQQVCLIEMRDDKVVDVVGVTLFVHPCRFSHKKHVFEFWWLFQVLCMSS